MCKNKIKIVVLYQVIMHYRLPFYNRIANDSDFELLVLYGRGLKNTKLISTDVSNVDFRCARLFDIRIPLPFSPTLFYQLYKENPDVVFSEGSSSLINATIAFFYSKIFKKKFIWWSLGALKDKKYKGLRKLINYWELYIENRSDSIFTYSTKGKEYFLKRGIDKNKIFTAINVFDTSKKLDEINSTFEDGYLDNNCFNLGFIGSIEKSKNLELLIDVVHKLNKKYKNIKLHIIGDGSHLNFIKSYVEQKDEIVFYGRMNYGSSKILGNCDVFVMPGLGGLAICEAMLNRLPVITGNADGTEYDLVDDYNGFIIENMNVDTLYDKIEFLYENFNIIVEMKKNSFKKITEDFSFENYYAIFKQMIHQLKTN